MEKHGASGGRFSNDVLDSSSIHENSMHWVMMAQSARMLLGQSVRPIVATFFSLLVILLIALYMNQASKERKKYPPGPRPWPIVGNLPDLTSDGLPHRSLSTLAAKYGGLIFLRLGSLPCIVISTAAVAKELFQTNDAVFSSRPSRRLFFTIFSKSDHYRNISAAPYGPYWKQVRKLCATELFSSRRHASYQKARKEEIQNMMKVLLENSKRGDSVNLKSWLYGVTSNNTTRMVINKRYFGDQYDQREREEFQTMISRIATMVGAFIISDYVPWLSFIPKLQGWHSKFEDLRVSTDSFTKKMFEVEKHRQRAKEREQQNDEDYVPDFVDVLLEAPFEDGQPLPENDFIMMLMDVITAGTETSATTVEWAMAELMLHPDVMKRAQNELHKVVGEDRVVQESDLPNLPYLQAVIKEVFRMHPAAALGVPRQSTEESTLCGYKFPAKTQLILNISAIHRDPGVYTNPNEFDPERFVNCPEVSLTAGYDSYELIPFGVGRRMCPAYNLATMMVSLMLAHLLHSYNWSLPEGQTVETFEMSEHFGITVSRKDPVCLVPQAKSPAFLY